MGAIRTIRAWHVVWHLVLTSIAAAAIGIVATPAHAQLAPGCVCPAGLTPVSATTCAVATHAPVPAICTGPGPGNLGNLGHIAAAQQQQSFWGIGTMLQQKRDQLQSTPRPASTSPSIPGYASSILDGDTGVLDYAAEAKKTNPLASNAYDKAPAPAPAQANPVIGAWVQGLGDWEHDNALSAADAAHFTTTYTAQGGLDRTQQAVFAADDALVLGVVSSWIGTHVSYDGSPITLRLTGPGVGVYSQYVRGGFSTDLTTKFDFLRLNEDFAGLAPNAAIDILNAGLSGNAQYKFTGPSSNFFEPTAGFSLTHTGFGSGAAALNLQDAFTLRLQAGARFGTNWDLGHGTTADASLKALVYGDAIAEGTSIASAGAFASAISPTDAGLVRGELDPEIAFNLPNDFSVTLSGQVRFGQAIVGGSAGINLRKQW